MYSQHWVRCEACSERVLSSQLQEHNMGCDLWADMHTRQVRAWEAYHTYRAQLEERAQIESILE